MKCSNHLDISTSGSGNRSTGSSERFQQRLPALAATTTTTPSTITSTASSHPILIRNQGNIIQNIRIMKITQRLRYQLILLVFLVINYLLFNVNSTYPSMLLSSSSFILFDSPAQQSLNSFNAVTMLDIDQVGGLHRKQIQHIVSHVRRSECHTTTITGSSCGEEGGTNLLVWLGTHHFNPSSSSSPPPPHHYQQQQLNQSRLNFFDDIIVYWHSVLTSFTGDGIVVVIIECGNKNSNDTDDDDDDNYYEYYRRIQERFTNLFIYTVQMQNTSRRGLENSSDVQKHLLLLEDLNYPSNVWTLNFTAIGSKRPNNGTLLDTTIFDIVIIDHLGHQTSSTSVDILPSIYTTTYEIIQNSFRLMLPLRPQQYVTTRQPYPIHVFVTIDPDEERSTTTATEAISTNFERVFPNLFFDRTPIRIIPSSNELIFNQSILSSQQPQTIHQNMTIIHNDVAQYVFYHNDRTLFRSKPVVINPTIEIVNEKEEISNTAMIQKELTDHIIHLRNAKYMPSASKFFYPQPKESSVTVLQSNDTTTAPEEDASSVPVLLMIDAPIYIHHHHKNVLAKPFMAVITSALSTKDDRTNNDVYQTFLFKHLISSIIRTVTESEQEYWTIQLFVAIDDTDMFWMKHWNEIENIPNWLQLSFVTFPDRGGHIPFNEIALTAYNAGADYFCRVNDDTEFLSPNWITMGVQILLHQYDPPNLGVVGPLCKEGNIKILTHDMVHRTHIDIFGGYYYPRVFGNWYLDDWITNVYSTEVLGIDRSTVIQDWIVKHWVADTRYIIDTNASAFLSNEYQIGLQSIYDYIVVNFSNYTSILAAMEEKILQTQQ